MESIIKKFLSIMMMLILLSSCSGRIEPNTKENAKDDFNKTMKDELILGIGEEPEKGFNPIFESSHSRTMLFHSGLLKRDDNLNIVNDLAKDYSISNDGLTYTVKLRKSIKFTDGKELTADDVVFTYNEAKKQASAGINLSRFIEAKKIDDYTIDFLLEKPDISFVSTLASLGIVPIHAYDDTYGSHPVGTGPFELVEWKKGQELIVKPNSNYYGKQVPFSKISLIFFKDNDQALATAKEGICDIIRIPYTAANMDIEGYHIISAKTIDNRGISLPVKKNTGKLTDNKTLAPNSPIGNDVTSDIAIRKALNIAIDRQEIIDDVLNGQATKAVSIADGLPWFNEDANDIKDGDINYAKEILDKAGWIENADGIREKDGLKAEFKLYYAYQDRENLAVYFSQKAKQIGINVEPIYGDWDFISPYMYSQAVLFGWGGYDPLDMYYSYSSKFRGYEYYNANFYQNEKVDRYFEEGLSSRSLEEMYANFKKAQWDGESGFSSKGDCPWIWMVNENHLYLVKDGLDVGKMKIEPHSSGWTILDGIANWKWKE